jgi:transaldolase
MKIYVDTVIEDKIDECMATGIIAGITTTPTFFVRDGVNPHDFYKKISLKYPNIDLQVELMGDNNEELSNNLKSLMELGNNNLTFKIPISTTAIAFAARNNSRFNFHLIYNVSQAIFAATAGATFICPLLGRFDDNGFDGVNLYKKIKKALLLNGFDKTEVMASSIRTVNHLTRLFSSTKVDAITLPPDILKKCMTNILTDNGVVLFKKDLQQIK